MEYLQGLFDWLWTFIAWLFVWQPGAWIKNAVQLFVAVGGAVAILYKTAQWLRGERAATRKDIRSLKDEAATKGDIENLKAELRAELRSRDGPGQPAISDLSAGLEKDLDKAVETLLAAGRADALKDKTGEAAEAALDELIAQRQAARERVSRDEADLYRQKGALAFLHDTDKAMRSYAKATELDPDDPEGGNELGRLQVRTGELDAAITSFEHVLTLGNQSEDQIWIAIASGNLGFVFKTQGDLDEAEAMYKRALTLYEGLECKKGMAHQCRHLGLIYWLRGDLDQAEAIHEKALIFCEELDYKEGMADQYGNLSLIKLTRNDVKDGEAMLKEALTLYQLLSHSHGIANVYTNLSYCYLRRGENGQAEAMIRKALAIYQGLSHVEGMAISYENLGNLYMGKGEATQACFHWREAQGFYMQIGAKRQLEQIEGALHKANCPAA